MTLDKLEGTKKRRYFTGISGMNQTELFTYQQQFGIHFKYRHQVYDQKIRRHTSTYLDKTWATKLWKYCKIPWYISVSEDNTALESGNFQIMG